MENVHFLNKLVENFTDLAPGTCF